MEYREEKEKELKEIFDSVKEKFPEVKVEVEHECVDESSPYFSPIRVRIYTVSPFFILKPSKERYLKRIVIQVSDNYFTLPLEEKFSGIAHELGHVLHDTKVLNPKRLYKADGWADQLKKLGDVSEHKAKRLKKWALLREFYADKQAVIKGYGGGILSVLKRLQPPTKEIQARISNLEKILKH